MVRVVARDLQRRCRIISADLLARSAPSMSAPELCDAARCTSSTTTARTRGTVLIDGIGLAGGDGARTTAACAFGSGWPHLVSDLKERQPQLTRRSGYSTSPLFQSPLRREQEIDGHGTRLELRFDALAGTGEIRCCFATVLVDLAE